METEIKIKRIEKAKPHSFEFRRGGAGSTVKVYFKDPKDLENILKEISQRSETYAEHIRRIQDQFKEGY